MIACLFACLLVWLRPRAGGRPPFPLYRYCPGAVLVRVCVCGSRMDVVRDACEVRPCDPCIRDLCVPCGPVCPLCVRNHTQTHIHFHTTISHQDWGRLEWRHAHGAWCMVSLKLVSLCVPAPPPPGLFTGTVCMFVRSFEVFKYQPRTGHTREPDPTHNELKHTTTRKTATHERNPDAPHVHTHTHTHTSRHTPSATPPRASAPGMPNERDMSTIVPAGRVEHPRLVSDVWRGFIRVIRVPVCPMCPLCVPAPSGVLFTGPVRVDPAPPCSPCGVFDLISLITVSRSQVCWPLPYSQTLTRT